MKRRQSARLAHNRGETLVEAIVSFAVIALILVSVTGMVKAAIGMNNRASALSEQLEADCTRIESGVVAPDEELGEGKMRVTFDGNSGDALELVFRAYKLGMLAYFE